MLFKPIKIDNFTGYKDYSTTQITILDIIISLRDMGFAMASITVIIREQSDEEIKIGLLFGAILDKKQIKK